MHSALGGNDDYRPAVYFRLGKLTGTVMAQRAGNVSDQGPCQQTPGQAEGGDRRNARRHRRTSSSRMNGPVSDVKLRSNAGRGRA